MSHFRTKLDEQKAEIERLLTVLDNKMDNEKKQAGMFAFP